MQTFRIAVSGNDQRRGMTAHAKAVRQAVGFLTGRSVQGSKNRIVKRRSMHRPPPLVPDPLVTSDAIGVGGVGVERHAFAIRSRLRRGEERRPLPVAAAGGRRSCRPVFLCRLGPARTTGGQQAYTQRGSKQTCLSREAGWRARAMTARTVLSVSTPHSVRPVQSHSIVLAALPTETGVGGGSSGV